MFKQITWYDVSFTYPIKKLTHMKKFNAFLALVLFSGVTFAQTTWTIDKNHSKIGFNVTHMAVSEVEGKFNDFDGSIVSKSDDFNGAQVQFVAKTASVDTDNEKRDGHLKSPDFFEADKYPEIKFTGTLVKDGGKYKLKGDLTMHGTTKPVEFDVTYGGTMNHPKGTKAGFKLTGKLNRQDYGLTWANKVPTGEMVVSDEVELIVKVELDKKAV
jgi:polyisoprenoid-binding protein YceI